MNILIVEDDQRLVRLLTTVLRKEHGRVDAAYDSKSGLALALGGEHDVAIIDWVLPDGDGLALCRAIRAARRPLAILMLSGRSEVEDRVLGLDSGADDYLVKPFAVSELLARLRALGRRFLATEEGVAVLRWGDLVLNLRAHTAHWGTVDLQLTATEWNLLEGLMRSPGRVLTRQQILDYAWSYDSTVLPTMVDVYISYLRRKLRRVGRGDPIQTVRSVGYRLVAPDA
jgi:DNA-binding response OmpR family regulator